MLNWVWKITVGTGWVIYEPKEKIDIKAYNLRWRKHLMLLDFFLIFSQDQTKEHAVWF